MRVLAVQTGVVFVFVFFVFVFGNVTRPLTGCFHDNRGSGSVMGQILLQISQGGQAAVHGAV